ncbi:hypothetical protein ACS0TY_011496 [Phlomoides rotata]
MIEISGLIAPTLAILIQFSDLFFARRRISMAACFCSSILSESRPETSWEISSSELSEARARKRRRLCEEVVANSPDLSLLQSLKAEEEESLMLSSLNFRPM